MKNRISIGISSIVLIFLILCLAVFSLLSLSDAKTALSFSERHADAVRVYYEADAAGQAFLRDYRNAVAQGLSPEEAAQRASAVLPQEALVSQTEDGLISCEIPMSNGQKIRMEFTGDGSAVTACYVFNDQEYTIDTRMPVFGADGEPE